MAKKGKMSFMIENLLRKEEQPKQDEVLPKSNGDLEFYRKENFEEVTLSFVTLVVRNKFDICVSPLYFGKVIQNVKQISCLKNTVTLTTKMTNY